MMNFIAAAKQALTVAKETPEILALLTPRGYTLAKLTEGLTKQAKAEASFAARQAAMGAEVQAQQTLDSARTLANTALNDFRQTVRAATKNPADREALGVLGRIPADTDKLVLSARTSYTNARKEPFKTLLAAYGYDDTGLSAAEATVTALEAARTQRSIAASTSVSATATRNTDATDLEDWLRSFQRITKVALRTRPDLLAQL